MAPREASRIALPAGIRVKRQSTVPVYVQLKTQLRHLIVTGSLKAGSQLPTVRQLASFLGINRNTVVRVLADLQQDGCLDSRQGRGTFVSVEPPVREAHRARRLEQLVERALERARRLGFTPEEFLAAAGARAPLVTLKKTGKTRALLVECNWQELSRYGEELESELPLAVDRILLEELAERSRTTPAFLRDYRVVITTLFHLLDVKKSLAAEPVPVVGLLTEPSLSTLLRLAELPEGTAVGLASTSAGESQNLLRSIQSAGLTHLRPVLASTDDPWSMGLVLKGSEAVVCSEQALDKLRTMLPPGVEVIVAHRILSRGSLDLLRDLLQRLAEPPGAQAGSRMLGA